MAADVLGPKQIEKFLQALANCKGLEDAQRIGKLYPTMFPERFFRDSARSRELESIEHATGDHFPQFKHSRARIAAYTHIIDLAYSLRAAWDEPDQRLREWYVFNLRRNFHRSTNPDHPHYPPELTPFERVMFYFHNHSMRAHHCGNRECPAPYFLGADNRPQRYCSPKCAGPAKREAKRKWWAENRGRNLKGASTNGTNKAR
jgi:hypothetical protein